MRNMDIRTQETLYNEDDGKVILVIYVSLFQMFMIKDNDGLYGDQVKM